VVRAALGSMQFRLFFAFPIVRLEGEGCQYGSVLLRSVPGARWVRFVISLLSVAADGFLSVDEVVRILPFMRVSRGVGEAEGTVEGMLLMGNRAISSDSL
jgi:hypothetical protein